MRLEKGEYKVIAEDADSDAGKPGDAGKNGGYKMSANAKKMEKIPLVGQETPGPEKTGEFGRSKIQTKAKEYKSSKGSNIYKGKIKTPDWSSLTRQALSRAGSNLSDKIKRMTEKIVNKVPVLNWKKELKKLFDSALKGVSWQIPNKRFVHSGDYLYGVKRTGVDTLKTIVAAVDTSASISREQSELFLSEIVHLCKLADADTLYIIYCSDDIDGIDIVKRGKKPDFSKWATTGGNSKGFIPPFKWVEKNKIVPSVFIYFTDTGGQMPDEKQYGISKYKNKVIWFLTTPEVYNKPPFGKSFWVPLKEVKKQSGLESADLGDFGF